MKLWSGRFTKPLDEKAEEFNASLPFDKQLYRYDIEGSIAHCTMLGACGIIPQKDAADITAALSGILADIDSGKLVIDGAEDIHTFVETELIRRIGDVGKRVHTARSRNDQVALDIRMYVKDCCRLQRESLAGLVNTLIAVSKKNIKTVMPGYTHMQKAQPTTLAHHLSAYTSMFLRDIKRLNYCYGSADSLPLGSLALAGSTYPIDREMTGKLLDFSQVSDNSMDAVSDRDFALDYLYACSVIAMHCSRIAEELIIYATDEFKFIELSDRFSTGSSIMPNKKNPDILELIRGKTGRVYGNLTALLTLLKGLPLAYNKDMQEDKEPLFDTTVAVNDSIVMLDAVISSTKFNASAMRSGAAGGYSAATDAADYLVKKGMAFRDAHSVAGQLVLYCIKADKTFDSLTLRDFKKFSKLYEKDILEAVKLDNLVNNRNSVGGTSPDAVTACIRSQKKQLEKLLKM